jgi:hypothetical protein
MYVLSVSWAAHTFIEFFDVLSHEVTYKKALASE